MAGATTALLLGTAALAGIAGSVSQADAEKDQGEYQKRQFELNSSYANLQADDALARGHEDASKVRQTGKQVKGAQRAALAAQGIDPNVGSALDIQGDTEIGVAQDIFTVENNAWREAFGYRSQASNYSTQGDQALKAGNNRSRNTIITGGLQAIGTGAGAVHAYNGRR